MLDFYIKLAGVLSPVRKFIKLTGFLALAAAILVFFARSDERGSSMVFLCVSLAMLCMMLIAVSHYFTNLPAKNSIPSGFIKRIKFRFRFAIAWVFSVLISMVILQVILLGLRVARRL